MGSFVIAYVPTVEEVDKVNKVTSVDNVTLVDTVNDVNTVHKVLELPTPAFPKLASIYNYQEGKLIEIGYDTNMYQAFFIPTQDCEFKGINICFDSYNLEDTYDVYIGTRPVIKHSHVKEMSERRILEIYEQVPAGTPVIIQFYNNSGEGKHMTCDFITIVQNNPGNYVPSYDWEFTWEDTSVIIEPNQECILVISQPNYVMIESIIDSFTFFISDLTLNEVVTTINYENSVLSSNYVENNPLYQPYNLLARVNVIGIYNIIRYDNTIQINFKNYGLEAHEIQLGIHATVSNI